jgi:adenine-specific DNA-methyltransferase
LKQIAFFPTPEIIVNYMIQLSEIQDNDFILDTGCGKGIFLENINNFIKINNINIDKIIGIELDKVFIKDLKFKFKNENSLKINLINQDFLTFKNNDKITKIIGNPPYINSYFKFDEKIKNNIKNITKSGAGNIYYAFIINSIELLEENGILTYIVPYDFFYNTFAKYTREYMLNNGYFTDIVYLGDSKIFKNAIPETIIFKYIKSLNKSTPLINVKKTKRTLDLKEIENNLHENNFKDFNCFKQEQFDINDNIWFLSSQKQDKNIEYIKLKDIKDINISVGIVNGADSIFKFNKNNFKESKLTKNELKYIKKFIKTSSYINNFNEFVEGEEYIFIEENFSDEELKNKLPNLYNYLIQYKIKLKNRKLSSTRKWYKFSMLRNIKIFNEHKNKLKLHVSHLTRRKENWFFKSKNDNIPLGDLITITSNDEELLIKLFNYFNSNEFNEYYKEVGLKGNRIIFTHNILSNLKIPVIVLK